MFYWDIFCFRKFLFKHLWKYSVRRIRIQKKNRDSEISESAGWSPLQCRIFHFPCSWSSRYRLVACLHSSNFYSRGHITSFWMCFLRFPLLSWQLSLDLEPCVIQDPLYKSYTFITSETNVSGGHQGGGSSLDEGLRKSMTSEGDRIGLL